MSETLAMNYEWIKSDDNQYVKQISEKDTFHVLQVDEWSEPMFKGYACYSVIIDLENYEEEYVQTALESFGYESSDEVERLYGSKRYKQIIAECLAELEMQSLGIEACKNKRDVNAWLKNHGCTLKY